tara:strand:- start:7190 stop:7789 length:600 start_codon:yes stop_codon:yes gene_type:complete
MKPLNQNQVDFLSHQLQTGKSIPGQSLTNNPENPYPWEKPPEFVNINEASNYMFKTIFEPDVASNILLSINNGVGVFDLASIILYTGFLEGKWNPDLMMLLAEPTMFMIIALCEKADLEYKLESVEEPEEMSPDTQIKKLKEGTTYLKSLRKKVESGVSDNAVTPELKEQIDETSLPTSLLDKANTNSDNNSLLSKGEI